MNFDRAAERLNTDSWKWDGAWKDYAHEDEQRAARDAIPMGIADMDFLSPPEVIDSIEAIARQGVYGYTFRCDNFFLALQRWLSKRHGWKIPANWIDFSPSVLPGIAACVRAFTNPGDKIILQTPVYYPFFNIIEKSHRLLSENPLLEQDMSYTMDFEDLERKAQDPDAKLLILCSPHNPVGRVWKKEELEQLCDICVRNHVVIVADEIHSDLIMSGHKHIPLGAADERILPQCVIFYAPSKTFNLAGLQTAAAVISNPEMKAAYQEELRAVMNYSGNPFGLKAFQTAYDKCGYYVDELCTYIGENYKYASRYLKAHAPGIRIAPLEATYLMWLDLRGCGIPKEDVNRFMLMDAQIVPDNGDIFSSAYKGYTRLNLACTRSLLQKACEQLVKAIERYSRPSLEK